MEDWDAQKMLDLYILDYMKRKNMHTAADIFAREADVCTKRVAIESREGFLTEWWSLFWDVYTKPMKNRRAGEGSSSEAAQMAGNVTKPDVNDLLQSICPKIQGPGHPNLPEIVGSSMVPRQNMEIPFPTWQRPDPKEWIRVGPPIDFNFIPPRQNMVGTRMNELERLRLSSVNLNSNSHLLDQHQLACMLASSSNLSLPQNNGCNNRGLSVTRGECGNSMRTSSAAEPTPQVPEVISFDIETTDTGRDRLGNQVPSVGFPSTVVGYGSPMPNQQQQFPASAPQVQQNSIFEAQASNNMGSTNPIGYGSRENDLVGENNQEMEKPLDEEVDSYFSNEEVPDNSSTFVITSKKSSKKIKKQGFSFELARCVHPTTNKFTCCNFSTMGNFLVAAGHEMKVFLWNLKKSSMNIIQGHSQLITDICFKPNSTIFATSSFDRTVRIYDAANPTTPYFKLVGHAEHVVSLDFNPGNPNLMCSCDSNDEIRLWNVFDNVCLRTFKGANTRIRFQPRQGNLLAASTGNVINLIDVETGIIHRRFEGHDKDVHSLCWDNEGKYLVSVSEESARFWSFTSGGKSVHELHSTGNKFASGTFHPKYAVVALGLYQTIDIWNPALGSRTWSYRAHEGIVSCLANASETNTIASVSHDQWIKLWR